MNNHEKSKLENSPTKRTIIAGSSLGTELAVAISLFAYLGYQGDKKFNSSPWCLLAGLGFAFIYGGYAVWKLVRMMSKPKPNKDENTSDASDN